jgi:hypothetical protein
MLEVNGGAIHRLLRLTHCGHKSLRFVLCLKVKKPFPLVWKDNKSRGVIDTVPRDVRGDISDVDREAWLCVSEILIEEQIELHDTQPPLRLSFCDSVFVAWVVEIVIRCPAKNIERGAMDVSTIGGHAVQSVVADHGNLAREWKSAGCGQRCV